jgi:hypothetical protein
VQLKHYEMQGCGAGHTCSAARPYKVEGIVLHYSIRHMASHARQHCLSLGIGVPDDSPLKSGKAVRSVVSGGSTGEEVKVGS